MTERLSVEFSAIITPFMQGLETIKKSIEDLGNAIRASTTGASAQMTQEVGKIVDVYGRQITSVQQTATATKASEAEQRKAIELTRIAEAKRIAESENDQRRLLQLKADAARAEATFRKDVALSQVKPKAAGAVDEMDETEAVYAKHRQDMLAIDQKYSRDLLVLAETTKQQSIDIASKAAVEAALLAQAVHNKQLQAQTRQSALMNLALQEAQAKRLAILKSENLTDDDKNAQLAAVEKAYQDRLILIALNGAQERIRIEEQEAKRKLALRQQAARQAGDAIELAKLEAQQNKITAQSRLDMMKASIAADAQRQQKTLSPQELNTKALQEFKKEVGITYSEYLANIDKARDANIRLAQAARLEGALQALNQISLRAAALGAAISAGFGAAIKPAADLEKQLAAVQAVSGKSASKEGMAALRDQAIDLGRQFVYTSAEIANGMKFLAQAGFEVPQIKVMTKDILDLAMAADMPLKDAFNMVATTIRAFSMNVERTKEVVNTLTTVANETNVEVADLGESFKYAGPVAAAAGVAFKDVASALGIMANAGIKGSMGGTALRQTISSLIAPTSNQRKIIRELGLTTVDATGKFVGFNNIVGQLEQIFRDKIPDAADQAGIAMKLFGDRAGPGMLAVINAGQVGLNKLTKAAEDAENGVAGASSAAETAAQRMNNLQDSITKFGQATSGLFTTVLYPLLGILKEIVNWAARVVNSFTDFAKAHPIFARIAAAFTAIVAAAGLIGTAIAGAAMAMAAFGLTMAANAKHGITFSTILKTLTTDFFSLVPAAGAAGGAVTTFGKAVQLASKGTFILALIGTLLAILPFIIKLFGDWGRSLGLLPPTLKDNTDQIEGLSGAYKSLGDQVKKTGEAYASLPEEQAFLKANAPPTQAPPTIDAKGKETLAPPPTSQEYLDWLLDIESQLKIIDLQAESLRENTTITGAEYAKQEKVLLNKRSILANLVKASTDVTKANLDLLATERQNLLATLQRTDLSALERENAVFQLDAVSRQIGLMKSLTKEYDKQTQQGGRLAKILNQPIGRRLAMDVVVDNLDLTILRYQELNKEMTDREDTLKRQLAIQETLERAQNTTLTQEELARNAVNRELEGKTQLLQELAQNEAALLTQARARFTEEQNFLKGSSRLQTEAANIAISEADRIAKAQEAQIRQRTESSAEGAANRTQAEETELERRGQIIIQQEQQIAEKKKQILESMLALEKKLYEDSTAAVKRIRKAIFDFEVENGDKLLAYKRALQDKTIKMEIDDLMRQVRIAQERVEYQKKFGTPEGVIEAQRELASKAGDVMVTLAGNITELRKSMSTREVDLFLSNVSKLGVEGREIAKDIRASIDAREIENRMLDTARDKAYEQARALAVVKDIQKNAANEVISSNQARLASEEAFAEKSKQNIGGLEAQIAQIKKITDEFVQVFQKADIKQVKLEIDANFEGVETEWQKLLNQFAADGKKGIPLMIIPQMSADLDAAMAAMKDIARRLEQLNKNRAAAGIPAEGKATGGPIPGYGGGDTVPTVLERGEWVIRKEAVRKYGDDFLHMLNASVIPTGLLRMKSAPRVAMATGGPVGQMHRLAISVQNKTYEVRGTPSNIAGLMDSLKKERLTRVGER